MKTVTHGLLLIRVDFTEGTCCNIMAFRAWATEVESANVRLVKVANKVYIPKIFSLYCFFFFFFFFLFFIISFV